jgi:hypothetical protein
MISRKLYPYLIAVCLFAVATGDSSAAPRPSSRYFPVTGYMVAGSFLTFWNTRGGVPQLGLPISNTYMERNSADGKMYCVQYFERARLEYHPEQSNKQDRVMLGLVGVEAFRLRYPSGIPTNPNDQARFSNGEVEAMFFGYWITHNQTSQLGNSVSGIFMETEEDGNQYSVQYFERARLEDHPEVQQFMLGLVGSEVYHQKLGGANAPQCKLEP